MIDRHSPFAVEPDITLEADVLVLGGGPAGLWAALAAAEVGARVVLVDKAHCGTSGPTAAANTGTWYVPPDQREAAIANRLPRAAGLADPRWVHRVLDASFNGVHRLAAWGYAFPLNDEGKLYAANLRGADYLRFMRHRAVRSGVRVLDHCPALELLGDGEAVAGAAGVNRQDGRTWRVRGGAVVLATGGCAFKSKALGCNVNTGDGLLMAAEAGAAFTGMEFSGQYGIAPLFSAVSKGLPYFWASFSTEDGTPIDTGGDRITAVARALLDGPVFAVIDKADAVTRDALRQGQPNCFLPFDRLGIDPFAERFPVTLRAEGTVRGTGGIRLAGDDCATGVPGLYAAGDAASRQMLAGAGTGGGGPNASWAIASGLWSGAAAAAFARSAKAGGARREVKPLGGAGLRPVSTTAPGSAGDDVTAAVQREALPLDGNYFRTGPGLARSLARLDELWRVARDELRTTGPDAYRAREAAAMVATARWCLSSALARAESRGMHRRLDRPTTDVNLAHPLTAGGLDDRWVAPLRPSREAA